MTREQLDLIFEYIDWKLAFCEQEFPSRSAAQKLNAARDALYATIETHTPLEDVTDAELCGMPEEVTR